MILDVSVRRKGLIREPELILHDYVVCFLNKHPWGWNINQPLQDHIWCSIRTSCLKLWTDLRGVKKFQLILTYEHSKVCYIKGFGYFSSGRGFISDTVRLLEGLRKITKTLTKNRTRYIGTYNKNSRHLKRNTKDLKTNGKIYPLGDQCHWIGARGVPKADLTSKIRINWFITGLLSL